NTTAATRLFDVLDLLATDPRIQLVFTCPGSSAFTRGTARYLKSRGIHPIPWTRALSTPFDAAIAASYGGDLHRVQAPLTVIPHGMGYNKYLKTENGKRKTENGKRKTENGLRAFHSVADARGRSGPVADRALPRRAARSPGPDLPAGRRP